MRSGLAALACLALVGGATACGSDDNDGGTTAATTQASGTTKAPAAETGVSKETIDGSIEYTGGTAGKADASKPPVTIGFTTMIGGTPAFPEQLDAAKATVKFINEQLGGIAGHPLALKECHLQTEEDGQKCGAEFLDAKVPVVNQALAVIGNESMYKTLAGKIPVLVGTTSTGPDSTTKGVYSFTGGGPAVIYAMAKDAANEGYKNVALVSVGNPGGKFTMEKIAVPALDKLGVKSPSKTVYYSDTATTPDIVSALQAAGGAKADAIFFDPSGPQQCTSLYDGMKQLGIDVPVLSTPICNAPSFIDTTGGGPSKWRLWGFNENPRVTDAEESKAYNDIMDNYGGEKSKFIGFASSTIRDLLTIAKFGNDAKGEVTPENMKEAILAYRGPTFMIPGEINCNTSDPATVSICGKVAVGSVYDGAWKSLGGIEVGS